MLLSGAKWMLNQLCVLYLAADIRCTTNRQAFKTLLKFHFFRQAFDIS